MAEVIRYINTASTAGGDGTTNATSGANRAYASFSEWQSAESALHTPGNWHHVIASGSGALVDSFTVTSTGWGSSDFILIEVDSASRPVNGVPKSGLYLSGNTGSVGLVEIQRPYVYVVGLDVENTHISGHGFNINSSVTNLVLFKNCIAKAGSTAYRMSGAGTGGIVGIVDSIAYDSAIGILSANWTHLRAYGCTIDNCTDAIKKIATTGTGRITARNNVVIGGTNKYATPLADHFNTSDSASNATSDASTTNVPGANPVANITSGSFTDYAGNNFNLESGSALINAGATSSTFYDDYDRAEYTVPTSDFLGVSRPQGASWDIGAFEFESGGGGFMAAWSVNSNRIIS